MERTVFFAVIVGGLYALGLLILLGNAPIAIVGGTFIGCVSLLRRVVA